MRRTALVGAACLALMGSTLGPATAAPGGQDRLGRPVYLALGDSVPAGIGATPKVSGYPELLVARLEDGYNPAADKATPGASVDFELANVAVPGATTTSLIAGQLQPAVDLIGERDENRNPHDDVEVVTVTIGGNDVSGPAIRACVATLTTVACQTTVDTTLAVTRAQLTEVLQQLVTAAGRDTEVVVTTYYNPIGSCFLSGLNPRAAGIADVVLEGGRLEFLDLSAGLNDVIREVAAATGAQVAELYGELDASQYVGGPDCLHPDQDGHAEIAEVIGDTLAR